MGLAERFSGVIAMLIDPLAGLDDAERREVEQLRPKIDAVKAGLDRGLSPERLRGPASLTVLHSMIATMTANLSAALSRVRELEARIEAMESGGVRYCGTWQKALRYAKGSVVTHQSAMWTALVDCPEGTAPGASPAHWQLSAKAAEDGVMQSISLALQKKIEEARAAAARAVKASAETAERAAARAESAAKARRLIERTLVTRHDPQGRILEFERETLERDAP